MHYRLTIHFYCHDIFRIARYQEANPAVYTVITFPFLFAVMFGDWGHGLCLLVGALVLIAHESKLGSQVYSLIVYFGLESWYRSLHFSLKENIKRKPVAS